MAAEAAEKLTISYSGYGFSHIVSAFESARLQPLPFLKFGMMLSSAD